MSWDVLIQDFGDYARIEDIPDDFQPQPIGSLESVISRLQAAFPNADFTDPAWGILDNPAGSIEFNIGEKDPVQGIMLHVRGGDSMADVALEATESLGCRAIDMTSSTFLSREEPAKGMSKWRAYRDQVMSLYRKKGAD